MIHCYGKNVRDDLVCKWDIVRARFSTELIWLKHLQGKTDAVEQLSKDLYRDLRPLLISLLMNQLDCSFGSLEYDWIVLFPRRLPNVAQLMQRKASEMGELSEEEQRWVCPNDRQLCLRAKWVQVIWINCCPPWKFIVQEMEIRMKFPPNKYRTQRLDLSL